MRSACSTTLLAGVDAAREQAPTASRTTARRWARGRPRRWARPMTAAGLVGTGTVPQWRNSSNYQRHRLGVYAQDLVQVAPHWKLLGGLRWDRFKGDFEPAGLCRGAGRCLDRHHEHAPLRIRRGAIAPACCTSRSTSAVVPLLLRHLVQHLGRHLPVRHAAERQHAAGEEPQHRARRQARLARRQAVDPRGALFRTDKYNERNHDCRLRRRRASCCRASAIRSRRRARRGRAASRRSGRSTLRTPGSRWRRSTRLGSAQAARVGPARRPDAEAQRRAVGQLPADAASCASAAA